jgi:5-methylcytosine-specific restriction protein A
MPNKPTRKQRPWQRKRVPQQRSVDMSWYYNDTRWRKYSKSFKERYPFCLKCEELGKVSATVYTDHIKRLRDGGAIDLNILKDEDFQPLCTNCHASKSGKEAHGYKENKK